MPNYRNIIEQEGSTRGTDSRVGSRQIRRKIGMLGSFSSQMAIDENKAEEAQTYISRIFPNFDKAGSHCAPHQDCRALDYVLLLDLMADPTELEML